MKLRWSLLCTLTALVGRSDFANAIIIRHDRDGAQAVELAKGYSGVVHVGSDTGTVVDANWVLTAAHVVDALSPFSVGVRVGDEARRITAIRRHPSWIGRASTDSIDLALVRVTPPIHGSSVAVPYRWDDEEGKTVTIVGAGAKGNGLEGWTGDDGIMRAATNVVDDTRPGWLILTFDAPPGGTDLEGVSGPGDSGGPAFIVRNGKRYIVGVSSTNKTGDADGPCRYKSLEYYARVSTSIEWINSTIHSEIGPDDDTPEATPYSTGSLPDTSVGRVVKAFFKNYAAKSEAKMRSFEEQFRSSGALADMSASARAERWISWQHEKWPTLQAREFIVISDQDIAVLAYVPQKNAWQSFRFMMDPDAPDKLNGISIEPAAAPTR